MNFQLARKNMIEQQVRPWHVLDNKVLDAMSQVQRETFVPVEYLNLAYSDSDIPLGNGQTMLPPKIVGRALQAMQFTGTEKVLEIGTGTGYVSACLSLLCATVISVEIEPTLLQQAQKTLSIYHNIHLVLGDAAYGWAENAPYDAIVITGSYPLGVPQKICDQLNLGGRLFAFCGKAPNMQAVCIERKNSTHFETRILFETSVPALVNAPQPPPFQF